MQINTQCLVLGSSCKGRKRDTTEKRGIGWLDFVITLNVQSRARSEKIGAVMDSGVPIIAP